ncbi:hypothetical protein J4423_02965 [Candidatus Pacearchaeota archaeon]|nr:hypothetical protein [Candidatus Pacearchaeota archaeon]
MDIDVEEVSRFFNNYREMPMPRTVRELILDKCMRLKSGQLESGVLELTVLRDIFAPDIAKKLSDKYGANNMEVPTLRIIKTPENFVYDPNTGEYLGKFDVKSR